MLRVVVLDGHVVNPGDLSWQPIKQQGDLTIYARSNPEEVLTRGIDAEVIITNKCIISAGVMEALPNLKCVLLLATGYNNVDLITATAKGIKVFNAMGYSTPSVAQQVFAYILHHCNRVQDHANHVGKMGWCKSIDWSYSLTQLTELARKTIGIYGFGRIGQQVGQIAQAFDMKVLASHKHPERDRTPDVEFVSFEHLIKQSDFITLHAPLSGNNRHIINYQLLLHAKKNAVLINTGRGDLINNQGLVKALNEGLISSAYLDVLDEEPPKPDHILASHSKCYITPHHAWATVSSRQRLIQTVGKNLSNFINGDYTTSLS